MCLMDAAGGNERCSSTREIPLTSIISRLQKWRQLSYKAKKREDGGCSCQTEILLRAVTRITSLQAAMKYRRDGCGRKKEDRSHADAHSRHPDIYRQDPSTSCSELNYS